MKNKSIYFIVGGVFAALIISILLFSKKNYNWQEHYKMKGEDPYGTKIITQLLQSSDHEFNIVKDSISAGLPIDSFGQVSNYVFIGQSMYMSETDVAHLIDYAMAGNNVFLFCNYIPHDLMFYLYDSECEPSLWDDFASFADTTVALNVSHPNLYLNSDNEYVYLSRYGAGVYQWRYFYEDYFCETGGAFAEVGRINDQYINFARVQYGDGYFYLHTTPIAFTNINLLKEEAFSYTNKVFSHLNDGPIYWDEYSRIPESVARQRHADNNGFNRNLSSKSPLQYILSQPALKWAWYLLLSMGLLFLIFRARRRERIIPVLEPNTNSSLEFVRTIGRLYFLQNNHKKLALQKMKLFHVDMKEFYNLNFQDGDEQFEDKLAAKSGVDKEIIHKIFFMNNNIKKSPYVSANVLIDFYRAMAKFYKTREVRG